MAKIDLVTVEIIRNALETTAREMSLIMLRTAHAPIFSEAKDFSCGIYDVNAQCVAEAQDCPIHLASIQFQLAQCLEEFRKGGECLEEGDVLIANDPYLGGSHLPDITMFKAIYVEGDLVGYVGCRAHHVDVGGGAPGSFVAHANEIFEEGIRIPPIKLYQNGKLNMAVRNLILMNVRNPDCMWGDLSAQVGALNYAEKKIKNDLVPRFGVRAMLESQEIILDHSESLMKAGIGRLPDGEYQAEDYIDDDGVVDIPYKIQVMVKIKGEEAVVDFTGSAQQAVGPINSVYAVTAGAVYIAFLNVVGTDIPTNGGCYRPITIIAPPGTVINPREPASCVAGNTYTSLRIIDTVRKALSIADPELSTAGFGEHVQILAGGVDPDTNQECVWYEHPVGGWGATSQKDGEDALMSLNANCRNTPTEVFETRFPSWAIRRFALRENSGGEGKYWGGKGIIKEYELLKGSARISLASDRKKFAPYGFCGGRPGKTSKFTLVSGNQSTDLPSKLSNLKMSPGDRLIVESPGGGGWGTPTKTR
jgi:N-methylhydantoinase B